MIFNDGSDPWGPWTYFSWYYHFAAENLLGGMAALAANTHSSRARSLWKSVFGTAKPTGSGFPAAEWLIIPWKDDWRDSYGMNEFLVKNLFPQSRFDSLLTASEAGCAGPDWQTSWTSHSGTSSRALTLGTHGSGSSEVSPNNCLR